jgi:Arylsulfotransferase (ASST)
VRAQILAAVAGVALVVAGGAASANAADATISTTPKLNPPYRAAVPDYTVPCTAGTPVNFMASIPEGQTVAVDGGPPAQGSLDQDVSLEPGQAFTFTVTSGDASTTHDVRCTPADFPTWRVERRGVPASQWIAFAPTQRPDPPRGAPYNVIVDAWGVPVWWAYEPIGTPTATTVLGDGTVTWGRVDGAESHGGWEHVKLDGTTLPDLDTVGRHADHHDFQQLPNGNHLMIAYEPRRHANLSRFGGSRDVTVFDGEAQEVTPDGRLVWSWNTRGHIKPAESQRWRLRRTDSQFEGKLAVDLVHMNSVQYVGPNLLVSARNADAVYLVRRSDGKILWKLGGTHTRESLRVKGDPHGKWPLDGQHDARMQADGTVSVHDNGIYKPGRRPRMVRYRINRRTKTARLVQVIRDGKVGHSYCCGSAQRLSASRWLIDWGSRSRIEEVTGSGRRILAITLPDKLFSYRAQSVAPGVLTREALQAGMNAMFPRRP